MTEKSVLISGIGIAGPALAWWLKKNGYRPTLIERAPALRNSGYVVDFWGLGYDIAEKMGLMPAILAAGYHMQELRIVDARGQREAGFGIGVLSELTGGRYVTIGRSDLSRLLYEALGGSCETLFDTSIASVREAADGMYVTFERGADRRFDLVIGADGLHSNVRRLVFGPQSGFEKHLGYVVAAFETSGYRPRDEDAYVMYGVPNRQLARFALHGDRTLFLFILAGDGNFPREMAEQKSLLRAAFAGTGWEEPRILERLDACKELYFDRVSQIRMNAWSRGRTALLGDAAFCVSFLAGQGAALALTSAYVLAGELTNAGGDHALAFRRYEELLRKFIAGKQRGAERLAPIFVPRTRRGLALRAAVMNLLGAMPWLSRYALGRDIVDRIVLPKYEEMVCR